MATSSSLNISRRKKKGAMRGAGCPKQDPDHPCCDPHGEEDEQAVYTFLFWLGKKQHTQDEKPHQQSEVVFRQNVEDQDANVGSGQKADKIIAQHLPADMFEEQADPSSAADHLDHRVEGHHIDGVNQYCDNGQHQNTPGHTQHARNYRGGHR